MPSNATETIDARILRLIGLEDTFDLDYDTYLTLLKEAMVKGRMPQTTIPSEEVELLTDEWKRVKTKKDKGRFKVKKKKITATSLNIGSIRPRLKGIDASKLLPAAQTGGGAGGFDIGESFSKIAESVTSIAKTLSEKNKLSKKESEFDRRAEETEKRKLQKENLKKSFSKMAGLAQKVMQPVQSILDKIIRYFVMIFIGNIVIKLIKWFSDEKNQEKIKTIFRFISDWWPALLGGWLLFGTSLGGLIRSIVPMIVSWTARLGKILLSNPWMLKGAAAAGLFAAGAFIPKLFPETVDEQERKTQKNIEEHGEDKVRSSLEQKANSPTFWQRLTGESAEAKEQLHYMDTGETKSYGFVSGEKGVDKVDAKLTDGEFVMSKGAVDMYGVDKLEEMNAAGGGTNRPVVRSEKVFAHGGGLIGGKGVGYTEGTKRSGSNLAILTKYGPGFLIGGNDISGLSIQSPKVNIGDINLKTAKKSFAPSKDYIMFPKGGRMGFMNKKTGKWISRRWSSADKNRYVSMGGDLSLINMGIVSNPTETESGDNLFLSNGGNQFNSTFNMGGGSQSNSINILSAYSQTLNSFGKNQNPSGISYNRPKIIPPPPPSRPPIRVNSGSGSNIQVDTSLETSATPFIPSISVTGPDPNKAAALGSPLR